VVPAWLKAAYTLFVAALAPAYAWWYGPANFLWSCDLALFVTAAALWREDRLLASMAALATLVPELAWNLDFWGRLAAGRDLFGLDATAYMFDARLPLWLRGLSLFHVFLPVLLLWLVQRLGYDRRALAATTALCWLVLAVSYLFTDPARNLNWAFGFGDPPRPWLPAPLHVVMLMLLVPLLAYLPAHWLLARLYGARR
jgi:hypothetical protein